MAVSVLKRTRSQIDAPSMGVDDPLAQNQLQDELEAQEPPKKQRRLNDPSEETPMEVEAPPQRSPFAFKRTSTLKRPRRPRKDQQGLKSWPDDPNLDPFGLLQPVRTSVPGHAPSPFSAPPDLAQLVQGVQPPPLSTPGLVTVPHMRKFPDQKQIKSADGGAVIRGGNQHGKNAFPHNHKKNKENPFATSVPPYADYTERRPDQMLADLSDIMLADIGVEEATEVEFGYGMRANDVADRNFGGLDLFASTNNPSSQAKLQERLANPMAIIKRFAMMEPKDESEQNLQQVALKLLFHEEQDAARRQAIQGHPERERLEAELDLASAIRTKALSGQTTVVGSDASEATARHAEQNIADHMHAQRYDFGEIAGTKIRCGSCSSELAPNLFDAEDKAVIGSVYPTQSSPENLQSTVESIRQGRTRVAGGESSRSRASSPVRLPKQNKVQEKKDGET
jgi:hypothetical protein